MNDQQRLAAIAALCDEVDTETGEALQGTLVDAIREVLRPDDRLPRWAIGPCRSTTPHLPHLAKWHNNVETWCEGIPTPTAQLRDKVISANTRLAAVRAHCRNSVAEGNHWVRAADITRIAQGGK